MKKTVLLLFALVASLLFQKKVEAQRFRGGVSGGLISSDVYGDDPRDYDNDFHKVGYVFGGFVNTPVSERGILQFEINLIQKGTEQFPDSNNQGNYKLVLNYVEIPLIYKHRINLTISKKTVSAFDIQAGASFGQLIHSSLAGDSVARNPDMSFLNKTDVSVLAGIDYNFSDNFNFCIRYSNSVIPVFKRNSIPIGYYLPPYGTFNNGNNMVWHFMFQYTFGKSKGGAKQKEESDW